MQYLVSVGEGEKRDERIAWLKAHGFVGNISSDYLYSAIIVEENYFFGGNVSCFSAYMSSGNPCLSWEEWLQHYEKITNKTK